MLLRRPLPAKPSAKPGEKPGAGLTAEERTRRVVALTLAETQRRAAPAAAAAAVVVTLPAPVEPAEDTTPAPHRAAWPEPDCPVVTITIDGPAHSGKSVIAHVIRNALAREGIACSGPDGLRSLPWRRGLVHLIERGLGVVLRRGADHPEGGGA